MDRLRDAWVEVDTSAISRNVRALKALTRPGTLFMAVVKADGYGHGAIQAARAAIAGGADRIGVATVTEGLALRAEGVMCPIHVLAEAPVEASDAIVAGDLTATVFLTGTARSLSKAALAAGKTAVVHLKIDTGMNRIGVRSEEVVRRAIEIRALPGVSMEGVFTHFATADVPGDWDFDRQMERLSTALEDLRDSRVDAGIVHAANSPATILHAEAHLGMVRCGIAIYGLHPAPATHERVSLNPAMSVKARVTNVHRVETGEGVSYGYTWRASTPTDVATIPLGYADGLHRILTDRIRVLAGGRSCRQVGRICMDQCMFEVPRGRAVETGDEVVIVGAQGSERIALEEVAAHAGTINYEMACAFSMRMPRVYF